MKTTFSKKINIEFSTKIIKKNITEIVITNKVQRDFDGKLGSTLILYNSNKTVYSGYNKEGSADNNEIRLAMGHALNAVKKHDSTVYIHIFKDFAHEQAESAIMALYEFTYYKPSENKLDTLIFVGDSKHKSKIEDGTAYGEANILCRDLQNMPANLLYPETFAKIAKQIAKKNQMTCKVFDEKEIQKRGMGGLWNVGKGSQHPPRFVILEYNLKKGVRPIVMVGKGITFDAGGVDIKAGKDMELQKMDMSGAGAIMAAMSAFSRLGVKQSVVGIFTVAENMVGNKSYMPSDVITLSNGKTVEIINTDAEGRVSMSDGLIYAQKYNPSEIIDMATLTNSAGTITCNRSSIILGNDQKIIDKFIKTGYETFERVWQLPLWDEYYEFLHSDIADYKNLSYGCVTEAILGAVFLSKFVGNHKWTHIDLAETEIGNPTSYQPKHARGIGSRLILNYLQE